ncbi:neprilysin-2-like [Venturia canescens]|uniref:neprilysin-2-like n=1 Tax=Venturia canescens TaxID=32260 RepID=UPI001C9D0472|nr:neprilysin-2-like [Venturia canescens]XP_043273875.1 neprilysin-2-like [Venturia canescens]
MGVNKFLAIVVLFTVTVDVVLASTYPLKNKNESESDAHDGDFLHRAPLISSFFKVKKRNIKELGNLSVPETEMLPSTRKALGGQRPRNGMRTVGKPEESKNECNSTACSQAAFRIQMNMDPDVDPCDNFYRFACGGFRNRTVIPKNERSVSTYTIIQDEINQQLKRSMEAESEPGELKSFKLVKAFYKSCVNETAIEAEGVKPLQKILKKLGGWPVLDGDLWNADDFNWTSSVYKFRDVGFSDRYFINIAVEQDLRNRTKRVIYVYGPWLAGLGHKYLLKGFEDEFVAAYYSYMVDIAVALGAPKDRAMKELKESLDFEMKLANISTGTEEYRDTTFSPMTIKELTKNYPSIPWKEYFSRLLPASVTIEEDEVVIVSLPKYFSDFEKLITETPKRVQANYVMWRAAESTSKFLNEDIRERQMAYRRATNRYTMRESLRWKECLNEIYFSKLSKSLNAMWVRQYFNEDAKKDAAEMITELREQAMKILKTVDWIDEKTRRKTLEKIASMSTYIAYPDELLDDDKLEKLYENLEFSEDNYFENTWNLSAFEREYSLSELRKPVNFTDSLSLQSPTSVNAYYAPLTNSIHVLAGILQGAFFNSDLPKYMNYGSLGSTIGHEITHGLDDEGRLYEENGNLVDEWEPSTKENYLKRASCIVDQFSNYTVEEVGLKINGIKTQYENIADIGGFKQAYLAYNSWAERNGPEAKLPGINRTPQQMFWISAANSLCSVSRPEELKILMAIDPHSPLEFEILGSFSNIPEFGKDFNCPLGSKMNPEKKCSVW